MRLVHIVEGGERAQMSKRSGDFVSLDELLDDIGVDAARWFMLWRSHDTTVDLDLELARRQSNDNPVYYVQYAHARIASILRKAGGEAEQVAGGAGAATPGTALEPAERELIKRLLEFPGEVREAAARRAPHRICAYSTAVAADFHGFYRDCQVVGAEGEGVERSRLALCPARQADDRRLARPARHLRPRADVMLGRREQAPGAGRGPGAADGSAAAGRPRPRRAGGVRRAWRRRWRDRGPCWRPARRSRQVALGLAAAAAAAGPPRRPARVRPRRARRWPSTLGLAPRSRPARVPARRGRGGGDPAAAGPRRPGLGPGDRAARLHRRRRAASRTPVALLDSERCDHAIEQAAPRLRPARHRRPAAGAKTRTRCGRLPNRSTRPSSAASRGEIPKRLPVPVDRARRSFG